MTTDDQSATIAGVPRFLLDDRVERGENRLMKTRPAFHPILFRVVNLLPRRVGKYVVSQVLGKG